MRSWVLAATFGVFATTAAAQTVTASWDANSDTYTAGYRLYYGTASGSYQWSIDTGSSTSAPVQLSPGTYYFAVRAYNATNDEGPPSGEVPYTLSPPPPPPPPPSPCDAPLNVDVTFWPSNKKTLSTIQYTSTCPIVQVSPVGRGQQLTGARFTDERGRVVTETR